MSTFSKINYRSDLYSKFRPVYSKNIYDTIYKFHENNNKNNIDSFNTVVDIGTGTGQIAIELSKKYKKVYGTDSSDKMIFNAIRKDNIEYSVQNAEKLLFKDSEIDTITVGQAFHWFNHKLFFNEASRILKPNGTLAVIGYGFINIKDNNEATELIKNLGNNTFKNDWDDGRILVNNLYRDIKFPFKDTKWYITPKSEDITNISSEINTSFMEKRMSINDLNNYIKTWSSYFNYKKSNVNSIDPVDDIINKIMFIMNIKDKNKIINVEWPTVLILSKIEK